MGIITYTFIVHPIKNSGLSQNDLFSEIHHHFSQEISIENSIFSGPVGTHVNDLEDGFSYKITFPHFIEDEVFYNALFDLGSKFKKKKWALIEYPDIEWNNEKQYKTPK